MTESTPAAEAAGTPLLAGIDLGTTHCKVGMFTASGIPAVTTERRYGGPRSYDAATVIHTVFDGLTECVGRTGSTPQAVGIASMAETGVPLDADQRPIGAVLGWADRSATAEAAEITDQVGRADLFARTGLVADAKHPLAKWRHWWHSQPQLLDRMRLWASTADLIAHALTGRLWTDPTLAGRTLGFNLHDGVWDADLLQLAGLAPNRLPPIVPAGTAGGRVDTDAARSTGLRPGTPVVIAGHDHLVGGYAAGVRTPGQVADSMGTAEAVITLTAEPCLHPALAAEGTTVGRHVDGASYCLVSGLPASGALVDWFCDRLLGAGNVPDRYTRFVELAASAPAEPTGIIVLPYPTGRAAPARAPELRMSFLHLDGGHGLDHLARAVLEGTAYQVRWMIEEQARHVSREADEIAVFGGSIRNRTWMSIKHAVTGLPTRIVELPGAVCAGAALLAGRALGEDPPALPATDLASPPHLHAAYQPLYRNRFLPAARNQLAAEQRRATAHESTEDEA